MEIDMFLQNWESRDQSNMGIWQDTEMHLQ